MSAPSFADLPEPIRMGFRYALDTTGAETVSYSARSILVHVPRGAYAAVERLARCYGLRLADRGLWYYPVTDPYTPDRLRHDGPNTAAAPCVMGKGYTLTAAFEVIP